MKATAISTEKTVEMMKLTKLQIEVRMFTTGIAKLDKLSEKLSHLEVNNV